MSDSNRLPNGVKDIYYKNNSLFGKLHRQLPAFCGLFDVDYITAKANLFLKTNLSGEESLYCEYTTDFDKSEINFIAIFDLKYKHSDSIIKDMSDVRVGTSFWAQIKMCSKLDSRFFVVIENGGCLPLFFYEFNFKKYSFDTDNPIKFNCQEGENVKDNLYCFWKNTLKLFTREDTMQDILSATNKYIDLKVSGENYKGCCPFHVEKTPSFVVNQKMQIWHCFGCGIGGDIEYFKEMVKSRNIKPII